MKNIINLIIFLTFIYPVLSFAQTRDKDPVVIKGSDLDCMLGLQPSQIVAFQYNGTSLVQIPVQVDEVVIKDIQTPYGSNGCLGQSDNGLAWNVPFYADPNTFTGVDTNPLFDNDDELVFMAKDAGSKLNICAPTPAGCATDITCELELRDPLNNALIGYVYLFEQNGTLNQSAGVSYVNYNFTYASNYQSTYDVCTGSNNTENSTVSTANYSMRFTGRWIEDELRISAGNATNMDLLDRHQAFVAINQCARTEDTFSNSSGPIVTSKNGPVRAIRSVMGSNSGTFNQLTISFTESRIDYRLDFRVHPIGGYYDVHDMSPDAIGMSYYNDQNPSGVIVNGVQDAIVTTNANQWELYTGNQGSIAVSYDYQTDFVLGTIAQVQNGTVDGAIEAYYDDGGNLAAHSCTGDGFAYGSSGFHLLTGKCTDRRRNDAGCGTSAKYFVGNRFHYLLPPSSTAAQATAYRSFALNPITSAPTVASLNTFCTTTNYAVITSSNPLAGGNTTGDGTYVSGASVTITATANTDYTFVNWTENGNVISSNVSYTFTISDNRNLVANFNPILGIDDFSDTSTLKIYPNPSSGKVIIETEFEGNLKVYNVLGQLMISSKITERQTEIEIYVSGFYQLILIDLYGNKTNAKLIINR